MKTKGATIINVEERQQELAKVITELRSDGKAITRQVLIKEMKKRGYQMDVSTLYRDRTELNQKNNYIRNFLPNYSAYQESINDMLEFVEHEALTCYKKHWTVTKTTVTTRETAEDGTLETREESITTEQAAPKVAFLNLILKTQELKQKHSNGENIQIAAVVIQSELNDLREKTKALESKNPILKSNTNE